MNRIEIIRALHAKESYKRARKAHTLIDEPREQAVEPITTVCLECNELFSYEPVDADGRVRKARFCSEECRAARRARSATRARLAQDARRRAAPSGKKR